MVKVSKINVSLESRHLIKSYHQTWKDSFIEFKRGLTEMKKDKKKEQKFIDIPEGYFRSVITGCVVKDTPKNRFRETIPKDQIPGTDEHAGRIIDEISKMDDITADEYLRRNFGTTIAEWGPHSEPNIYQKIDFPDLPGYSMNVIRFSKRYLIKNSCKRNKGKDPGKHYYLAVNSKIKTDVKHTETSKRTFKSRNLLEYVKPPSYYTGLTEEPTGEPSTERSIETDLWDYYKESPKIRLKDYQIQAIDRLRDQHGLILSFDTGTGKTITSVVSSICLLRSETVDHVYVVAPKSLSDNFKKETLYYMKSDDPLHERYSHYTHTAFVKQFEKCPEQCDNSLLIIDEASEFRTEISASGQKGRSAFTVINCCIRAKRVIALSATPLYNDFGDVVNLVAMVTGKPPSMVPPTIDGKLELTKGLFAFHNLLEDKSPGDEIDLPTRREHIHEFEMSDEYYGKYLKIQRSEIPNAKDPFAFLTGLRHGTNSIDDNPKIEWALDRVEKLRLKTILYSSFIDDGIRLIQRGLDKRGVSYVTISGELKNRDREEAVARYNDPNNGVDVMIISRAGSLGLDLKRTREVIFIEANWNPAQEEQVIGRACRLGSHKGLPVDEYYVDVHRLYLFKPSMDRLAEGDHYPSADSILKSILERKEKELKRYLYLLRGGDINPEKAKRYRKIFEERYRTLPRFNPGGPKASYEPPEDKSSVNCPYKFLGVTYGSSLEVCEKTFRKLSLELHPDRNYNATPEVREANMARFKKIADAMDKIRDK